MIFLMDNIISKEGHFDIDLEKGILSGELSSSGGLVFGPIRMKPLYSEPLNSELGSSNGLVKVEEGEVLSVVSSCGDGLGNVKPIVVVDKKEGEEKSGGVLEKKQVSEKPKVMMSAKKPPRPPRGLSLDSADQKLIRELHELAKFKRVRIERMKALKKAKEAKASSSKNHLFATLLTVLFGLVLLFQGISSRTNSGVNFHTSPIPSGATEGSVISIQHLPVPSTSTVGPEYESPRRVDRVSGFDTQEKVNSAVG